ncbi:hypothetical protein ASPCAL15063 [Aspergillus calidoustus]|uniref:HMA domain-containing protein n=1 Tax=Aspergillus calidoustus TaxID=454130 RepID=A0A0U5GHN4_ASPCI|nr:hypothetical protein ASPCAL15063 [Aspergillus calidoustus]
MGCDCSGPPAPAPEPDVTPISAPTEETTSCQDACCDSDDTEPLDTTAPGQGEPTLEKPDDGCSPGKCTDNKTENDTDAPDCCRGKVGPCCDTSCLDRLAMRECEMSAAAAPGPNGQPTTCGGATDPKACSQHSLSALDRYGATLQALGCICRTLIALGQESCCEIRERHSLDGKQCSKKSSVRSLLRTPLDSCGSNNSVTKDQVAQKRLRLRRDFGESARSIKKPSADACVVSSCSKDKPPVKSKCSKPCCSEGKQVKEPRPKSNSAHSCCTDDMAIKEGPTKNQCSCSCRSEDTPATAPSVKDNCVKSCYSLEKPAKQPAAQTGRLDSLCSETPHVEESPPKVGCLGSCCPRDQRANDIDSKSIHGDTCCSKVKPVVEPPTSGCAGSCCRIAKNTISKKPPNAASSGSCCNPPTQDIVKTPKTNCADSCCAEKQPASPQNSCTDACCSSAAPSPSLEIKEAPIQAITDIENQGTGKEHVVLSISGMTCTGCETNLNRTLVTVPAVKDLKTSLVLSRAEFNIDLRLGSVEEVMKHLERTTEFKCERVQNQGSSLDLIVPDMPSKFISQTWPDGVIDMSPWTSRPCESRLIRRSWELETSPRRFGVRQLSLLLHAVTLR